MIRLAVCGFLLAAYGALAAFGDAAGPDGRGLERLRQAGDLAAQRRHAWALFEKITAVQNNAPQFESWHGEGALFGSKPSAAPSLAGFSRAAAATPTAGAPVLTYTLYNDAAFAHIVGHHLNQAAALERLRRRGDPDPVFAGNRDVPAFPRQAMVLKTAWWPVAGEGVTALPVWDPMDNPPKRSGNPYIGWKRVVAVDARGTGNGNAAIDFAGRRFANARILPLSAFYHVAVTTPMARAMMADSESRKAALIALGRPLRLGDDLVLVGANLASREIPDWIWAAFWWHDRPEGTYAAGRPADLTGPWRNYLMQVAFDAQKPAAADGGAHIAFNPWLEGRFPNGGKGGGSASNCQACHARASYPATAFLPVTRGPPDPARDPAFAGGRLRTGFLWSLALHAKPPAKGS